MAELRELDRATTILENEKHPADYEQLNRYLSRAWFTGTPTRPLRKGEHVTGFVGNMGPTPMEVTEVEDLSGGRVKVTVMIRTPPP